MLAARDTPAPQVRYSEVTNSPISGIAPPALAAVDPSAPDVPQLPPRWVEFGGGVVTGTIVGITPFGTMVDPVRTNPALGNHTDDYLFGKAAGEFAGGIAVAHVGLGVIEGGAALALTGKGTAPGVAVAGIGSLMVLGGAVNATNALHQLFILMKSGGGGTTSAPPRVNGNSAQSTNAQVGYEITDTKEGEIVKTGISGGPRTSDGGSIRANGQVNQWNRQAGEPGRYKAEVVKEIPAGPGARREAIEWEKANALRLKAEGHLRERDYHVRP